ncbi:hypothetical protein [Microbacterium sp. 10M-3C3]|jgi:hypothetical protein|uniref:hypothetical protein n=1 Tax=Microbacterium sp. 10M-3C3 TaxID=2483401 RepID=UPI001F0BD4BD|nr:hypothetical protein [Microbacterium sp. 10M-3C3]
MWTNCAVGNSGSQIDIVGQQTQPGRGGSDTGGSEGGGGGGDAGQAAPPPPTIPPDDGCTDIGLDGQGIVAACPVAAEEEPAEEAPGIPPVTAADVASFAPDRPPLQAEPAGVGVVGMPANFTAGVGAHTRTGTLFGRPVTVRFTPVAYVFDYGDGAVGRSSTGGASWQELGLPQFSATPTSHAYAARGTYTASVTVEYAAEVDFGVGTWFPVRGVVTAASGGYPVEIFEVRTALVDKTCVENPAGPGC